MITFDEYKEICAKWNLVACSKTIGVPELYKFKQDDNNYLSGMHVCHYSLKYGVKVLYNLKGAYGPWLVFKEDMEIALSRIFKLVKEYNINMKKIIIEQEFCK